VSADCLQVELREDRQLLHLTLDTPKANIIDTAMMAAIERALDEHVETPTLKAIAFEGAGTQFSFGASVQEHRRDEAPAMLARFHNLFRRLYAAGVPTIAIVRGHCLGGGLELAAYCTWVFAAPNARFGQPEISLAVFPPLASVLLPWRIGGGAALDLCVSGRTIDANEALRVGLVGSVRRASGALVAAAQARRRARGARVDVRLAAARDP